MASSWTWIGGSKETRLIRFDECNSRIAPPVEWESVNVGSIFAGQDEDSFAATRLNPETPAGALGRVLFSF